MESSMSRSSRFVIALLAAGAAETRADTVDGSLTTLLNGHAEPRDGRIYSVVLAYELVDLNAAFLKLGWMDELKLKVSAWGGVQLAEAPAPLDRATGDVDLGYLEGRLFKGRLDVRIGRQLIVGGAARTTQIDGVQATLMLFGGLGVTGYGGVPVTPRFGVSRGDAVGG